MMLPTLVKLAGYVVAIIGWSAGLHAQTLDRQEKCAVSARRAFFEDNQLDTNKKTNARTVSSDYQSHYNPKIDHCLILVRRITFINHKMESEAYLADAIERRTYAYLFEQEGKILGYTLTPSIAKPINYCKTRDEFDQFVAGYME